MNVTLTATEIVNRLFNGAEESAENRVAVVEGILSREQRCDLHSLKHYEQDARTIRRAIDMLIEQAHAAGFKAQDIVELGNELVKKQAATPPVTTGSVTDGTLAVANAKGFAVENLSELGAFIRLRTGRGLSIENHYLGDLVETVKIMCRGHTGGLHL